MKMKSKNINTKTISSPLVNRVMKRWYILMLTGNMLYLPGALAQQVAVKSNLLYDLTTTVNLGLEVGMAPKWSLDLPVSYNPWEFSGNKKMKHWLIQPELRYWFCETFGGHFAGVHGIVGAYNAGGMKWLGMKDHRYQGTAYGAGVSYGYQWILGTRWSLEATVGIGYAYLSYAQYPCEKCASKIGDSTQSYFGPTKAGVSLIYILK
jgi:hypothetical protein